MPYICIAVLLSKLCFSVIVTIVSVQLIQNTEQHSVSYTLSRTQAVIVQYDPDSDTDMFQIGRSSEGPIDFVVMDTIPGDQRGDNSIAQQSTISRFACRIIVERNPPYVARIYAAGFDVGKNIFLGVRLLMLSFFTLILALSPSGKLSFPEIS